MKNLATMVLLLSVVALGCAAMRERSLRQVPQTMEVQEAPGDPTASMFGTVVDDKEVPVLGALVHIYPLESNGYRGKKPYVISATNKNGQYTIERLPANSPLQVLIESSGFQMFRLDNVLLGVGQQKELNARLEEGKEIIE